MVHHNYLNLTITFIIGRAFWAVTPQLYYSAFAGYKPSKYYYLDI